MTMRHPIFAFLALEEHPYARAMLRQLLVTGFSPSCIIEEESDIAVEEREKFSERISPHPVAPPIATQAERYGIPTCRVAKHDNSTLMKLLASDELDLIVLGGTRIIRGPILSHPKHGVLNCHPGLLPDCRGSASPAWSVYHDIRVGATAHFCDEGIDTGDVLLRRELPVQRGMNYSDLCYGTLMLSASLMSEALQAFSEERWPEMRQAQGESDWPTFKNAPPQVLEVVHRKLAEQSYAHYVDEAGGSSEESTA